MKKTLALVLSAACLIGVAYTGTAHAENAATKFQARQSAPSTATPGSIAMPATMKCMSGYSKTDEHKNSNGATDRMECTSPVFECPHKSNVINKNGSAANGQGIDIKKVPVGNPGDSNKFKIEYTCTYIWNQG